MSTEVISRSEIYIILEPFGLKVTDPGVNFSRIEVLLVA